LKGKIVSVTTDGFITDIPDLENIMKRKMKKSNIFLLNECIKIRKELSGKDDALELKNSGDRIYS
jgi:hypothetical protein